jgi:hypothetical protein
MMLQLLISYFAPDVNKMNNTRLARLLSAKVEYENEHVKELESTEG